MNSRRDSAGSVHGAMCDVLSSMHARRAAYKELLQQA